MSSAASATTMRSSAAPASPGSGSPPSALTRAKRRVASIVSIGSTSAWPASITLPPSRLRSTISSAPSASGTSRASPFEASPAVRAQLARGDPGQPALALLVGPGHLEREAGGDAGEEGQRRERVAELLHQDHELDDAEPLAAVLLGDEDPGPAELADLLPGVVVVAPALGERANALGREARREEVLGGALDRLLVVGEVEVHVVPRYRSFGRPSTRSATMFFRISVVPPSIELARARRKR